MANMTVAGAKSISNNSGLWHLLGTKDYGGLKASGTLTFNRWDSKSTAVSVGGSAYSNLVYSSGSGWSYRYHIKVALISGGNLYKVNNSSDGANHYVSGGNVILDKGWTSNYGSNSTMDFNDTIYISNNNETIYLCYWCGQEEGSSYDGCTAGYNGTSGRGHTVWVVVGSINSSNFPYNPYSEPSIGGLSITPSKGNHDGTFTYNYSISKGTNDLSWVHLDAYYKSNNNLATWVDTGRGFGNRSDGLSGGLVADTRYYGKVAINDGKSTFYTNSVDFNTHTLPNSSMSIGKELFSPQDNVVVSWNSNNSSNVGDTFSTKVVMNGKDVSTNISGSITLNASTINSYFTNTQRSISRMSGSISVTNTNRNSNKTHTTTKSFSVQYQPTQTPTSVSVTDGSNSVSGKTVLLQNTKNTIVSWSYPYLAEASGVVNGYILRVYSDSNYTQQYGDDINISVDTAGDGSSYKLENATQLKRGVLNYATITPYYTKPDSTGKIEGEKSAKIILVKPLSKINTPVISYPINDSKWHNKYFRVLLELPEDGDIDVIKDSGLISSLSDYVYKDIQVKITYDDNTSDTYSTDDTTIWSTSTFSHKKKIAICPALASLKDSSYYKISVRVQKNYYLTDGDDSWSNWANEVKVNVETISRQEYSIGGLISHKHYLNPQKTSVSCHGVYPISALPKLNVSKSAGDIIKYENYKAIYDTILQIKNDVNNYCTYDVESVSFAREIKDFTDNPPRQDCITAVDDKTIVSANDGRNYMNKLVNDLNKLY